MHISNHDQELGLDGSPANNVNLSASDGCLRVLVSVSSEMGRRGMVTMLHPISEVHEVECCAELSDTARLLTTGRFNVLIVSASTDRQALEEITSIADRNQVRTVVLLHSPDEDAISFIHDLPVDGFLIEDELTESSLSEGMASLAKGAMPIPGRLARRLFTQMRKLERTRAERTFLLTPREHQALMLLADGMSNKQIARQLKISEHGAKRHVANVLAKLNCPNRTLAVATALRCGLLHQEDRGSTQA